MSRRAALPEDIASEAIRVAVTAEQKRLWEAAARSLGLDPGSLFRMVMTSFLKGRAGLPAMQRTLEVWSESSIVRLPTTELPLAMNLDLKDLGQDYRALRRIRDGAAAALHQPDSSVTEDEPPADEEDDDDEAGTRPWPAPPLPPDVAPRPSLVQRAGNDDEEERMGWAAGHIERLKCGETVQFRPRGSSMSGLIDSGQLCTVEPVAAATVLTRGDIVLCTVKGRDYLHLVKAVAGAAVQIGNNRGGVNGWTPRAKVWGKLVHVED